jgi:hypothetical protein
MEATDSYETVPIYKTTQYLTQKTAIVTYFWQNVNKLIWSTFITVQLNKLHGLSPQANYANRATAAFRQSSCQLLQIEGVAWSAQQIPMAVFSVF